MPKTKIDLALVMAELKMHEDVLQALGEDEQRKLTIVAKKAKAKREGTHKTYKVTGARTTQPITSQHMIKKIANSFENDRDRLLYLCGILLGLRISDIVKMTYGQLRSQTAHIREQKTDKTKEIYVSPILREAVDELGKELADGDYVFASRKARHNAENREDGATHITTEQAWKVLKKAAKKARYPKSLSAHSLRKTFGYWNYRTWVESNGKRGASLEQLMLIFNHSSPQITLRYIGITQKSINTVYKNTSNIYGL